MRILITGAAGRLGGRLTELLSNTDNEVTPVDVVGEHVVRLDITDFAAVRRLIDGLKPDVVLHPAAWTDVDGCAREPDRAVLVNGIGAQNVALAAARVGAAVLHISTNEVFAGTKAQPYTEYDVTQPVNPYGYSKWYGERAVMSVNPKHYIVRTAWLFAHGGKNFIQTILNAAEAGRALRVVTDEVANPTYNDDLADAILRLMTTERYGIYHFTNAGACSRHQFARYVLDRAGYVETAITPITAREYPRPSTPPKYTALANHSGRSVGITLRSWQEAVDAFLTKEGLLR